MRRRDFIQIGAAAWPAQKLAGATVRKRIAALATTYHVRSHSDNFITRFLEGYWIDKRHYESPADIVSLFMDQVHPADIGHRLSTAYNFPVTKSIADALTLGTGKLSVDGVLLVAEHGDYPFNYKQQQLYPRYEFFEQVVQVFREIGTRGETVGPGRPEDVRRPVLCLIEYNDGFRAAILALGGLVNEYLVAFRVKGRPAIDSTLCYIPIENSNNFSMLVHGIAQMYQTGKPSHPVERTLLTTGALSFLMESAAQGHKRLETPMLRMSYKPPAASFYAHGRGS